MLWLNSTVSGRRHFWLGVHECRDGDISCDLVPSVKSVQYADGFCAHMCARAGWSSSYGCVVWLCRYDYQSALSQSHPGCFTLRYLLNLQRCIKVRHQMHHTLASPKHIIDSTHILLPIRRPICIKPTNYNPVAMGAIPLIGLISVKNWPYANFGHIPSRSLL